MDIQSISSDQINFFKFTHSSQYNSSIDDNENIISNYSNTSWKLSCIMNDLQEYQVECIKNKWIILFLNKLSNEVFSTPWTEYFNFLKIEICNFVSNDWQESIYL